MKNDPEAIDSSLECELARFDPADLSSALHARIARDIADDSWAFADRLFAVVTSFGGIAAGVILLIAVWQLAKPEPPGMSPADIALRQKLAAEYQQVFASR